jgi:hypothetical protein
LIWKPCFEISWTYSNKTICISNDDIHK